MDPSRRCGAAGRLLLVLCMSWTMVSMTTLPLSTSPVSMTTPPLSTSPVSMTTPPLSTSPVSMTTPPLSTAPVSITTPPLSTSPVSMTTPPLSTSPVSMTTPPLSTSPVSMTTPPLSISPVSMTTPPLSTSPVSMTTTLSSTAPVSMTTTMEATPTPSVSMTTRPASTTSISTETTSAPPNAEDFRVVSQTESSITLGWRRGKESFNYTLVYHNTNQSILGGPAEPVTLTVKELESARSYTFTLYTWKDNSSSGGVNLTALTAPVNIAYAYVVDQNSSSIHLQWVGLENISTYLVECSPSVDPKEVTVPAGEKLVNYTASNLQSASTYNFTVYSRLLNLSSSGYSTHNVTAPLTVTTVTVNRSLSEVVMSWRRDGNSSYLLVFGNSNFSLTPAESDLVSPLLTHRVVSLQQGTAYNYTITASYQGANSSPYQDYTSTTTNCSAVRWRITNSTIQASDLGVLTYVQASNGSEPYSSNVSGAAGGISLSGLYPGATYDLSVYYRTLLQCQHLLTLPPPDIRAWCEYGGPYAIVLHWAQPEGVWSGAELNVTKILHKVVGQNESLQTTTLHGFLPATTYQVSACFLSGRLAPEGHPLKSRVDILDCHTDPRGVIAGSVVSVLLLLLLAALAVFFWQRRRPYPQRQRTDFVDWSKPADAYQPIPAGMFEDHVRQMSRDDNRGFSEEYESFIPVGVEQTRKAAIIPDNKAKNRFTNVLPYDWSRVKLSPLIQEDNSDYINASYLPGYRGSREYIAAQGPLPGTLEDFWRMVWEQGVKTIAMVTNCTEGGRTKCEQYWPLDYTPCLYGDLLVTSTSEQTAPSWIIRSFTVKNRATSQQRSVHHFHFRAWPDHGVPDGTRPLLQFRTLLRRNIEEGGGAPTLVHCSAGVGRTGTLLALDVLLQQMEAEGKVEVASFVLKMRLCRPLMVQTESQYVFLHHCLLEEVQGGAAEEPTYQNWDMIYANATALQQLPYGGTEV
ncbi:hypothetical protein NHX12_025058 [Muraenolepis orangiensis]|uniref:protein-tyrosine-phosphatase n=1 Tax=Muraenolepis orangiensis TaxID=630683 RepID=A0A9Q0IPA8_9TELE|nr:hypothetical protein NHX12_025058 [Muraenolepis orangiensis]